jgi:hypothetical protein
MELHADEQNHYARTYSELFAYQVSFQDAAFASTASEDTLPCIDSGAG